MSRFVWSKKRSIMAIVICAILAVASFGFLQLNNNAQAAIIDPHPGLVGWWRFDEGTGTIASDSSGNANTGTINGATWVDGEYEKALSFDGETSYVIIPDNSNLDFGTDDFTISFWFNPTSLTWSNILYKRADSNGVNAGYQIVVHNNRFYAIIGDGTNGVTVLSNSISAGVWQHCLLVVNHAGSAQFYVNGLASGSPISMTSVGNTNNDIPLKIGGNSAYYTGILDEVRIYNRALPLTEIQAEFNGDPDFSANVLAKIPQGTTQVITTLSWQGTGNIDVTLRSPTEDYPENVLSAYQKSSYSTSNGITNLLNIKRLSISVTALSSDENWYMVLVIDNVNDYQLTVEIQR